MFKPFSLLVVINCFICFSGHPSPIINQQPSDTLVSPGNGISLSVNATSDSGPISYQWYFNDTPITNGILNTILGGNNYGWDGRFPAIAANIYGISSTALSLDSVGNLYFVDSYANVYLADINGLIWNVAGNKSQGFSGDYGYATNATLHNPYGVVVDPSGNIYVAEYYSSYNSYDQGCNCIVYGAGRIRKISVGGIISTIAGGGNKSEWDYQTIVPATNVVLMFPYGITLDSDGIVYFSEYFGNHVTRINPSGICSIVAGDPHGYGNGITNLNGPAGIAFDKYGALYVVDQFNQQVKKVFNGKYTIVAGKGPQQYGYTGDGGMATNATLNYPTGVAVDSQGNVLIADRQNKAIRKVNTNGIITTVVSNVEASGVTVDMWDNIYIAGRNVYFLSNSNGTPNLSFRPAMPANTGNYYVVASDNNGSVTSAPVRLSVMVAVQPTNQIVTLGSDATFTSSLESIPTAYQWYFNNPTIQSTAGGVAQIINGFVYGCIVTNCGSGYNSAPQVQFIDGGGNGAAGYAVVSNGIVMSIVVTNAGSGYAIPPTVIIGAPTLLVGQNSASINISPVTASNSGNYYLVVSNIYGMATSGIATLNLLQTPKNLFASCLSNRQLAIHFTGTPNYPYILEIATNLTTPIYWQPFLTNPSDGNGNWQFTDTNLINAQRFYRALGK